MQCRRLAISANTVSADGVFLAQICCCCRQHSFAADVRISSLGVDSGPSERLSFGAYDSTNAFQSHASLTAQPNGTLAVVSEDIQLHPSQGTAMLGSGVSSSAPASPLLLG